MMVENPFRDSLTWLDGEVGSGRVIRPPQGDKLLMVGVTGVGRHCYGTFHGWRPSLIGLRPTAMTL